MGLLFAFAPVGLEFFLLCQTSAVVAVHSTPATAAAAAAAAAAPYAYVDLTPAAAPVQVFPSRLAALWQAFAQPIVVV
jgi:hypothetical protein